MTITKMRDGEDGWSWKYQLKHVQVTSSDGNPVVDEDGDPVTTCVVKLLSNPAIDKALAAKSAANSGKVREMPRSLRELMQAIDETLIDGEQHFRPGGDGPLQRAIPMEHARTAFEKRWIVDDSDVESEPDKKRKREKAVSKAFNEALAKLPRKYCFEKSGKGGGWIWRVEQPQK